MDERKEPKLKNLVPLFVLRILQKHSNAENPLTQQQIREILLDEYEIEIERKAIGRTLSLLKDVVGEDIASCHQGVYLNSRMFEDSELRLLIDGVLQSKHISSTHSKSLIKRLCELSSKHFSKQIRNIHSIDDWDKTNSQALFLNIEEINLAIAKRKQITFRYNKYGVDGKLHPRSPHTVSPYTLVLHNQRYYLMGRSDWWKTMSAYRLDRITDIKVTDEPAVPITTIKGYEDGIDYKRIATSMPYMFTDTPERVEFIADVEIVDQIVDWFGKDVRMRLLAEDESKVFVSLMASPMAMEHWATQYINHVVITRPEHLKKKIRESLENALKKY